MAARVEGVSKLISRFASTPKRVDASVTEELRDIGDDLLDESQERAPYEEGDLRGAAYRDVRNRAGGAVLEAGYAGLPYIIVQHEGGWLNHMGRNGPVEIKNYTTPGTGSKFLEGPFAKNLARYKEQVRRAMRKGLRE